MATAVRTVSVALKRVSPIQYPNWVWRKKAFFCKMSNESTPLTHSITLPSQQSQPVPIVAAPGVSHSDFWSVTFPFSLCFYYYSVKDIILLRNYYDGTKFVPHFFLKKSEQIVFAGLSLFKLENRKNSRDWSSGT